MRRLAAACALSILPVGLAACSQASSAGGATGRPTSSTVRGHRRPRARAAATSSTSSTSTSTSTAATTSTASPSTTTTTLGLETNPAGALPQTGALPSASSPQFTAEMHDLWRGILGDSVTAAIWSFFPEAAYLQVKAIDDPAGDWNDRLVLDFELDLAAAHRYVLSSPGGEQARLLYVAVATSEVAWIPPGYCYNSIGYWHAPAARLVYEQDGTTRSIGIASLISWRGQWYVVHLGAVLRSGERGIVDDPSIGEGTFAPPGGC